MKTASNCQIAGALGKWQVKNDIYEQASSLLDSLSITSPDFQEAKRVIVNGHVIYSRVHKKAKKHCGYAVIIEHNGENFSAFVQYFHYESNSTTVFAVVKQIILDFPNLVLVSEKPRHLLRIAGEGGGPAGCASGLCTGKSSISLWKFKPCVCIKSSKFLLSLSLT